MRAVLLAAIALPACAGRPLDVDFPASLDVRGNCDWEFRAWSTGGDVLLRFRLDPSQFRSTDVNELSEVTFDYPIAAWSNQPGDLEVWTGKELDGACAGEQEPAYRYLPSKGGATLSLLVDYYDQDDTGCTVARGSVGLEFSGVVLSEIDGNADGVFVDTFGVSGDVEILDGCDF